MFKWPVVIISFSCGSSYPPFSATILAIVMFGLIVFGTKEVIYQQDKLSLISKVFIGIGYFGNFFIILFLWMFLVPALTIYCLFLALFIHQFFSLIFFLRRRKFLTLGDKLFISLGYIPILMHIYFLCICLQYDGLMSRCPSLVESIWF